MMTNIQQAFDQVCAGAVHNTGGHYVTLYVKESYYGGPEEGGWWGSDTKVVAYKEFPYYDAAHAAAQGVLDLAESLTKQARRSHNEQMAREQDFLDDRGLDADTLSEPADAAKYFVRLESVLGEWARQGPRHYE